MLPRHPPTAIPEPAPIARRGLAYVADTVLLGLGYSVLTSALDAAFGPFVVVAPDGDRLIPVEVQPLRVAFTLAVLLVIDVGYFAGSWALAGATPFQRLAGIAVRPIQAAGTEPGKTRAHLEPGDALRRWAVMALLPLCAGLLGSSGALPLAPVAAFDVGWTLGLFLTVVSDRRRRGLHDRAAGSLVVEVGKGRP
jgi:uncharacterized RDD family membrane protein YckC